MSPITVHPATSLAVLAVLTLLLGFKAFTMLTWRRPAPAGGGAVAAQFQEIEATLEQLRASISEIHAGEQRQEVCLDAGRRQRALALMDRGEAPPIIAATLRVPRNQIDLLLKVHRITARREQQELEGIKQ